jgi:hypothetical protein
MTARTDIDDLKTEAQYLLRQLPNSRRSIANLIHTTIVIEREIVHMATAMAMVSIEAATIVDRAMATAARLSRI